MFGGIGNDLLNGGTGADTMRGQAGNDTYVIDNVGDNVIELAGAGIDTIQSSTAFTSLNFGGRVNVENLTLTGSAVTGVGNSLNNVITGNNLNNSLSGLSGNDRLLGLGGNDSLFGGIGNDSLFGGTGNDSLFSDIGNDLLFGGTGNDLLNGGTGNDTLRGEAGTDTITTGTGLDTIRFNTALGAGNIDTITDYNPANDTMELDDAIFTALPLGPLAPEAFRIGAGAADADDRIIYNDTTGQVFYDPDGNVAAVAQTQFATLGTGLAVTNADFVAV
jgi:Ca2+-binding RTX toxin-like protein